MSGVLARILTRRNTAPATDPAHVDVDPDAAHIAWLENEAIRRGLNILAIDADGDGAARAAWTLAFYARRIDRVRATTAERAA